MRSQKRRLRPYRDAAQELVILKAMIANLRLQHFRSYDDASFEFSSGVNIIVGPNASGKTNLLEAVLVVARGASYRAHDSELIAFERPWARLDAGLQNGGERIVKLVNEPRAGKSYDIGGKPLKRLTLQHVLPVVLFEPNHLQLVSGSPDIRRNYLDDLLEQTTPGYQTIRLQYTRTLRQRNALLKRGPNYAEQLFPWNVRLSELAGTIVRARHELTETLNNQLAALYRALAHTSTEVTLMYAAKFQPAQYESHLLRKLEANQELDFVRGFTGNGPHREDLEVQFDNRPANETASRGEARTTVLALKILELQLLEQARGTAPLLLLDDVFSELDGARRHALTEYLQTYQTFITTTDADIVQKDFTSNARIIPLADS